MSYNVSCYILFTSTQTKGDKMKITDEQESIETIDQEVNLAMRWLGGELSKDEVVSICRNSLYLEFNRVTTYVKNAY